jgi:hypothetical protein
MMRSAPFDLSISAARADALFASALQRSDQPSAGQVRQAIAATLREFGDLGCAARVAQEYGEHPDAAGARMRWARAAVAGAFGGPPAGPAQASKLGSFPVACTSVRCPASTARPAASTVSQASRAA